MSDGDDDSPGVGDSPAVTESEWLGHSGGRPRDGHCNCQGTGREVKGGASLARIADLLEEIMQEAKRSGHAK